MSKQFFIRFAPLALIALPLAACGSSPDGGESEHSEADEVPEGPNGGKLLTDGDLGLEVTIFDGGEEPQFRIYPSWQGKAMDPKKVSVQIALSRLGGKVDRLSFTPQGSYLASVGAVQEPHSFDVEVSASVDGKRSRWSYKNYEGRTAIASEAAKQAGIETATAGPASIGDERELFGTVELDPSARSEIRGQFPGRVVSVTKQVGDFVRKGELLARINPLRASRRIRFIRRSAASLPNVAATPET